MDKPESFSNVEDRFKLTILQIEKRFVDLEMSISELKSKLKDINMDAITSLQQRVDDLDDLSMVENVGVIELKKMLEGIKNQFGELPAAVSEIPQLKERLDKLDFDVSKLSTESDKMFDERIKKLDDEISELTVKGLPYPEIEGLSKRIDMLKERLLNDTQQIREQMNSTKVSLENQIKNISVVQEKPSVDYNFLLGKINDFKNGLEIISDKKYQLDIKVAGLEEKIDILNKRLEGSTSQKFVDEVKSMKREIMSNGFRLDSMEKISKELTNEFQDLQKGVKGFENVNNVLDLSKNIEEKINNMKTLETQTNNLSSRLDSIFGQMEKFRGEQNLQPQISEINKKIYEMEKIVSSVKPTNLDSNKTHVSVINEKIDRLNKEVPQLIVDSGQLNDKINSLMQRMSTIDSRIGNLYQLSKEGKPLEVKTDDKRFSQVFSQLSSIEDKIINLEKSIKPAVDTEMYDEQIEELLGKLIFLESRMGAIEKSLHETTTVSPIILE